MPKITVADHEDLIRLVDELWLLGRETLPIRFHPFVKDVFKGIKPVISSSDAMRITQWHTQHVRHVSARIPTYKPNDVYRKRLRG